MYSDHLKDVQLAMRELQAAGLIDPSLLKVFEPMRAWMEATERKAWPATVRAGKSVSRGRPRRGEEDKTLSAQKPWAKEGMSRPTWYRRKKEKGKKR